MAEFSHNRNALEERWLTRLNDARIHLELARDYVSEVQRDFPEGEIPSPDGGVAYRAALRAENIALAEYHRVLRILTDLVARGQIPDEREWLRSRAAKAAGSE